MKKILILGATGMLGHAVSNYFMNDKSFFTVVTSRNNVTGDYLHFDALTDPLDIIPTNFDYVINCIGVIKPYAESNLLKTIKINSVFPLELGAFCSYHGMNLIHITTDCVFSGLDGLYTESSPHDALDAYGKSKSLGECTSDAMVLRTSIIGMETNHFASLVSWAISKVGQPVDGYITHFWNGITTERYTQVCKQIIDNDLFEKGLFHIHAQDDVSKYELLHYINKKFDLNLSIKESYPSKIDRTLRSEKNLCAVLNIPTVEQMVFEMGGTLNNERLY